MAQSTLTGPDNGALYVALGAPYLAMAALSARSLRHWNPDIPICIATDLPGSITRATWWRPNFDMAIDLRDRSAGESGYAPKTRMLDYSPFNRTLFLDCDTIVRSKIDLSFQLLQHFDVLCRPTHRAGQDRKMKLLGGSIDYTTIAHFNSGVLAFRRNDIVRQFFAHWQQSYDGLGVKRDQPSFVEAFFKSDARMFPLKDTWNAGQELKTTKLRDAIIIYHYKARIDQVVNKKILASANELALDESQAKSVRDFLDRRSRWRRKTAQGLTSRLWDQIHGSIYNAAS